MLSLFCNFRLDKIYMQVAEKSIQTTNTNTFQKCVFKYKYKYFLKKCIRIQIQILFEKVYSNTNTNTFLPFKISIQILVFEYFTSLYVRTPFFCCLLLTFNLIKNLAYLSNLVYLYHYQLPILLTSLTTSMINNRPILCQGIPKGLWGRKRRGVETSHHLIINLLYNRVNNYFEV